MAYQGRQPGVGVRNRFIYSATGGQTSFSGADSNGLTLAYADATYVDVFLNGTLLVPVTDYAATTKTSVVLGSGAAASDIVEIVAYDISSMSDAITSSSGGTITGNLTVSGNFSADGGTIKLDGNYPVGTGNVALGDTALDSITSGGDYNIAIGDSAGAALTVGDESVAVGFEALMTVTSGAENVGVGYRALKLTTGNSNVAVGKNALTTNSSGSNNTALGTSALLNSTTASNNTAVGHQSLKENTTGSANTAVGLNGLAANTTGVRNVSVGAQALDANTTGDDNVALGYGALSANTTASSNTAVGRNSLVANTTGGTNVAVGTYALTANTTAINNTAVGYQAGYSNTTGNRSVFLGHSAGYSTTTAAYTTAIGIDAGRSLTTSNGTFVGANAGRNTTGDANTFLGCNNAGYGAGYFVTTGSKNTIIGAFHGNQSGVDIRTASNQIVLSDGDGAPRLRVTSTGDAHWWSQSSNFTARNSNGAGTNNAFFTGLFSSSSQQGGSVSLRLWTNGNIQNTNNSYGALSDQKLKENIVDANSQWDDIKDLQVRNYNMIEGQTHTQIGVIAQEVETVSSGLVYESPDQDEDGNDLGTVTKSVNYSVLYMKAVKALQEAMARIETLETKVTALEG